MRCLILYAALLGAVAGYTTISNSLPPEITTRLDTTEAPTSSSVGPSSTTASSTTQSNLIEEVVSELPVSLPPILEEVDLPSIPHRRMVTYDQRQEGQYNIRADLDNFMIVLIPPGPSEGMGLLDLLTKSSLRRTSHTSKNKKKLYSTATGLKPDALKHLNYFRNHDQHLGASRAGEFIDGRTPYHVDIASLNDEEIQPRLNPDRQVDVLPPSYPVAYQHLMKPYHLEAESSLLPPSEIGLQHNTDSNPSQNAGYYRFARYIRGDNFLDSNRVTSSNRLGSPSTSYRRQQLPMYRSDLSMGAAQLYPPLDVPQFNYHMARNFGSKSSASPEDIDSKQSLDTDLGYSEIIIPPAHLPLEDDLELALNDDSLLEGEAKALLSDGIERCAPGKRRDSYGVCREIEGY
ncbi:hypothetical protein FF38_04097 [Lucilia cuprina]|uniref:Uncharacterized protein n=1 Tax=Lucilia cuprina TaxID=7375 RepID=A0A0L0BRR0_LUCCU|nr:hypothetical protein CVS40_7412 [Lucilia cuprina]KNC22732.1 hypothetical protein FF38_04097 [Lucilia cuprina]